MKKIFDFESYEDFGFSEFRPSNILYTSGVTTPGVNFVYSNVEGSFGKYLTMEDILSGGNQVVEMNLFDEKPSVTLSVDNTVMENLAYFGSVYAFVSNALNEIRAGYPNGFLVVDAYTGTNTLFFNNSNTYFYDENPLSFSSYDDFEVIQTFNDVYDDTFQITNYSTGLTYSALFLDGQPSDATGYSWIVAPKDTTIDAYYAGLDQYKLDLLVPPFDRTNYWPRDPVSENNILLVGTSYDAFADAELSAALDADNDTTNIMWRKMYPDGQKILDSDGNIAQKLILTFAKNFDTIKQYQDNLRYAHTVDYFDYNHIPKELVGLLADQWNWSLVNDPNQTDFSNYMIPSYENYITGQSQQKLTSADINYERWRRILVNVVYLYKKKGTNEGIKYLTNLYSIPEQLLSIEEIVEEVGPSGEKSLVPSTSNIVVPVNGTWWYVTESGAISSTTRTYANTKYLNINVSPINAIEFEFFDWAWEYHPPITNINGDTVDFTSANRPQQRTLFNNILQNTVWSNTQRRYSTNYGLLENEANIYYASAATPFSLDTLQPYMDFLDDSWAIIIKKLIPASSKILSSGELYRNAFWNREKIAWNESELEPKTLPFNDGMVIDIPDPSMSLGSKVALEIDAIDTSGDVSDKLEDTIDVQETSGGFDVSKEANFVTTNISGYSNLKIAGSTEPLTQYGEYLPAAQTTDLTWEYDLYGVYNTADAPYLIYLNKYSGSSTYVDYDDSSVIFTTANKFSTTVSGFNLSQSGYTRVTSELFRKLSDEEVVSKNESEDIRSIMAVMNEDVTTGVYKVSSVEEISIGDNIAVTSPILPAENIVVKVVDINVVTKVLTTTPSIGLFTGPIGDGSEIDWVRFGAEGWVEFLNVLHSELKLSYDSMMDIFNFIADNYGLAIAQEYLANFINGMDGVESPNATIDLCSRYLIEDISYTYASMLVTEFVKRSPSYTFESNVIDLLNVVVNEQEKATFKRIYTFFNWAVPDQVITIDNFTTGGTDVWEWNEYNNDDRNGNDFGISGTVTFGGLNDLNQRILKDKSEYFMRHKIETTAPTGWTETYSGTDSYSGVQLIGSAFDTRVVNNILYYGNYFTYMITPKEPFVVDAPTNSSATTATTASVILKWKAVSDSSRMEIQFLADIGTTEPAYADYTEIDDGLWSGSTVKYVNAIPNIDDNYVYTVQTTLMPDTYYWWRILNYRSKLSMFGNNLEIYSATEPNIFKTGVFDDDGHSEGEIDQPPSAPNDDDQRGGALPQEN